MDVQTEPVWSEDHKYDRPISDEKEAQIIYDSKINNKSALEVAMTYSISMN